MRIPSDKTFRMRVYARRHRGVIVTCEWPPAFRSSKHSHTHPVRTIGPATGYLIVAPCCAFVCACVQLALANSTTLHFVGTAQSDHELFNVHVYVRQHSRVRFKPPPPTCGNCSARVAAALIICLCARPSANYCKARREQPLAVPIKYC